MTVRPILFSGPMVRVLLYGRKTQTRQIIKPPPAYIDDAGRWYRTPSGESYDWPYAPGDLLWVREAWNLFTLSQDGDECWPCRSIPKEDPRPYAVRLGQAVDYRVCGLATTDREEYRGPWRPSIHMPRWASRLTLEITEVRVQRVQDISERDAIAEGCNGFSWNDHPTFGICTDDGQLPSEDFRTLWDTLNAKRGYGWDENPWVVALTFELHRRNVDEVSGGTTGEGIGE